MKLLKRIFPLFNRRKQESTEKVKQVAPVVPLKSMKCCICGCEAQKVFAGRILHRYDVDYFFCYTCEHLQTEEPFWMKEAYDNAISMSDTGILRRNIGFRDITASVIFNFFNPLGKFADYAGGYGVFTRLMRDIGFDFFWYDRYSANLMARGFEFSKEPVDLICAFEAMEHFQDPLKELDEIFKYTDSLIVSQTFLPFPLPNPNDWWYFCLEHGQHINLYSLKTFEFIANKYQKRLYSYGDVHLFTNKDLSKEKFQKAIENPDIKGIAENMKSKTISDMQFVIELMKKR